MRRSSAEYCGWHVVSVSVARLPGGRSRSGTGSSTSAAVGAHRERPARHLVRERALHGAHHDLVAHHELVEIAERRAVRGAVPGDSPRCPPGRGAACPGSARGPCGGRRRRHPRPRPGTTPIAGDVDQRHRLALGWDVGRRAGGARASRTPASSCRAPSCPAPASRWRKARSPTRRRGAWTRTAAEVVLGPGLVDPGAPELVGDEQEEQQAHRSRGRDRSHRARCASLEGNGARESADSPRSGPRAIRFDRAGRPSVHSRPSIARRRVCLPSSVSAPPSASSVASRRWPGSTSTPPRARSCCSRAPTAPGRPRCCGCSPGWSRCTRAKAIVLGHDLARDRRGARRDLALVGHETFCYDDLTVRENLRFAARAAGRDAGAADAALERLGLTAVTPTSCTGACRRASDAASRSRSRWSRDPRLLLLDEPHAGLDAEGREVLDAIVARRAGGGPHRAHRVARARARTRRSRSREVVLVAGRSASANVRPSGHGAGRARADAEDRARWCGELWREVRARRGQGPADRGALACHAAADRCPSGSIVLLLFAFALDPDRGMLRAGRARVCSGSPCCSPRCWRFRGRSRSRPTTARATACGSRASTGPRSSSARPRRSRSSCSRSRSCSPPAWSCSTAIELEHAACRSSSRPWPRPWAWRPPVPSTACSRRDCGCARRWCRCSLLPVVAPVLLGATRAWEAAIDGIPSDAWPWVGLLAVFAVLFTGDRDARLRAAPGGSMRRGRELLRARRLLSRRCRSRWADAGVASIVLALFGLWGAPPDEIQGDAQRLMYLHVPTAWLAYLAFAVTAIALGAVAVAAHPLRRCGTASPVRRPSSACSSPRSRSCSARCGAGRSGGSGGRGTRASSRPRSCSSCTSGTSRCAASRARPTRARSAARSRR